jgi:hypothetical protein
VSCCGFASILAFALVSNHGQCQCVVLLRRYSNDYGTQRKRLEAMWGSVRFDE